MFGSKDVFVHSCDGRFYLYAPMSDLIIEIDESTANGVSGLLHKAEDIEFEGKENWLEFLNEINNPPHCDDVISPDDEIQCAPTSVVLSLTKGCNLHCVYCYIHGGEENGAMDIEVAKAAIDFVAANAKQKGLDAFGVSFHGEGEPTFMWSLFKSVALYCKDVAQDKSIKASVFLTSNGMWTEEQYVFIIKHVDGFSISMDGLANVQNAQRPTKSGAGSFEIVQENLRRLRKDEITCSIRMTVMEDNLSELKPFLQFISSQTNVREVQVEPLFNSGRGAKLGKVSSAFDAAFAKEFFEARVLGDKLGLNVTYSGCSSPKTHAHFCGATGEEPNFVVMSSGLVSSCYEVSKESHKLGEFFIYGAYNNKTGRFEFMNARLKRLVGYKKGAESPCNSCFAQKNCLGDCLTRRELSQLISGEGTSSRCNVNRDILSRSLVYRADNAAMEPQARKPDRGCI